MKTSSLWQCLWLMVLLCWQAASATEACDGWTDAKDLRFKTPSQQPLSASFVTPTCSNESSNCDGKTFSGLQNILTTMKLSYFNIHNSNEMKKGKVSSPPPSPPPPPPKPRPKRASGNSLESSSLVDSNDPLTGGSDSWLSALTVILSGGGKTDCHWTIVTDPLDPFPLMM